MASSLWKSISGFPQINNSNSSGFNKAMAFPSEIERRRKEER
jgi:hypothetical protein